jgi:hypothetical protein
MKKKLQLSRETVAHLQAVTDLRRPAAAVAITKTNPSVVDGCPSTPVWCPQYTQSPCPGQATGAD